MAPVAISDTTAVTETAIVSTKALPVEKAEKEVTPLEAISHGDVLPGKDFCPPAVQVIAWQEHPY